MESFDENVIHVSKAHKHLTHLIGESLNLCLILQKGNNQIRISNRRHLKRKITKQNNPMGRGRNRRKFAYYFDQLFHIINMCLQLSISVRVNFLRLHLPMTMSRLPIPNFDYSQQNYVESEFSESELSSEKRKTTPLNHKKMIPPDSRVPIPPPSRSRATRRSQSIKTPAPIDYVPTVPGYPDIKEIFRRNAKRQQQQQIPQEFYHHGNYESLFQYYYNKPIPPNYSNKPRKSYNNPIPSIPHANPEYESQVPYLIEDSRILDQNFNDETLQDSTIKNPLHVPCNKGSATKIPSGTGLNAVKANSKRSRPETSTKHYQNDGEAREKFSSVGKIFERHDGVNKSKKSSRPKTAPAQNTESDGNNNPMEDFLNRYEQIVNTMSNNSSHLKKKQVTYEMILKEKKAKGIHTAVSNKPLTSILKEEKLNERKEKSQINQEKSDENDDNNNNNNDDEERDKTANVLQNMLNELMQNGYENKLPETENLLENYQEQNERDDEGSELIGDNVIDIPASINYKEMTEELNKNIASSYEKEELNVSSSKSKEIQFPSTVKLTDDVVIPQKQKSFNPYTTELHRSKSYIINLIDRALSKELGTPLDDKINYSSTPLKEDFPSNVIHNVVSESATSNQIESCPTSAGDEPVYIKQLKQMRWNHLQHIQREVKRLADLERFLDSCSQ